MRSDTKKYLPLILGAYFMLAAIFSFFAYTSWERIDLKWWLDLGIATIAVFGFLVPPLGSDLKRPKVFVVLAGLCVGHMLFTTHFYEKGWRVRPLYYIPIAILEIVISLVAGVVLGGARLEAFRDQSPAKSG